MEYEPLVLSKHRLEIGAVRIHPKLKHPARGVQASRDVPTLAFANITDVHNDHIGVVHHGDQIIGGDFFNARAGGGDHFGGGGVELFHAPTMQSTQRQVKPCVAPCAVSGHGAPMLRCLTLLMCMPTLAAAEWSPDFGRSFSYDATFDRCILDPEAIDLAQCQSFLAGTFDLNRAVADAVLACGDTPLRECPLPFEDAGLPAIAVRIAVDSLCDATDPRTFEAFTPLPEDHCVTMISDILGDEGVVPLLDTPTCTIDSLECTDIIEIHAKYWFQSVLALADTPNTKLRIDDGWNACMEVDPTDPAVTICHTQRLADIWSDLSQNMQ